MTRVCGSSASVVVLLAVVRRRWYVCTVGFGVALVCLGDLFGHVLAVSPTASVDMLVCMCVSRCLWICVCVQTGVEFEYYLQYLGHLTGADLLSDIESVRRQRADFKLRERTGPSIGVDTAV
jgi:hypothetical protein